MPPWLWYALNSLLGGTILLLFCRPFRQTIDVFQTTYQTTKTNQEVTATPKTKPRETWLTLPPEAYAFENSDAEIDINSTALKDIVAIELIVCEEVSYTLRKNTESACGPKLELLDVPNFAGSALFSIRITVIATKFLF
jgi:hypothetical protein